MGASDAGTPLRRGGMDPGRRAVRNRRQPAPGAPDHLPDRRPVLDLRAAPGGWLPTRRRRALLPRHPGAHASRRPVVQALTLTDVVVEAAVTALLLAIAVQ